MNAAYTMGNTDQTKSHARSMGSKAVLFTLLLICSLSIFLFGANYYPLFPTNGNSIYAASLSGIFLIAAVLFKRNEKLNKYWGITYALFVASAVNLVSDLFAVYNTDFVHLFGTMDTNKTLGLAKLYDTLLVVVPIIGLTLASGADLGSLFLKKGNLSYKWGFGIGSLVLVNYFTSVLIFFGTGYELPKLAFSRPVGIGILTQQQYFGRAVGPRALPEEIGPTDRGRRNGRAHLHRLCCHAFPGSGLPARRRCTGFRGQHLHHGSGVQHLDAENRQPLGRLSRPRGRRLVLVHRHPGCPLA